MYGLPPITFQDALCHLSRCYATAGVECCKSKGRCWQPMQAMLAYGTV